MVTYPRSTGLVVADQGWQMISSAGGLRGGRTATSPTTRIRPTRSTSTSRKAPYAYPGRRSLTLRQRMRPAVRLLTPWTTERRKNTADFYRCTAATSAGPDAESRTQSWELQPIPEQLFNSACLADVCRLARCRERTAGNASAAYADGRSEANEEWDRRLSVRRAIAGRCASVHPLHSRTELGNPLHPWLAPRHQ
jgi:hypothetical protein